MQVFLHFEEPQAMAPRIERFVTQLVAEGGQGRAIGVFRRLRYTQTRFPANWELMADSELAICTSAGLPLTCHDKLWGTPDAVGLDLCHTHKTVHTYQQSVRTSCRLLPLIVPMLPSFSTFFSADSKPMNWQVFTVVCNFEGHFVSFANEWNMSWQNIVGDKSSWKSLQGEEHVLQLVSDEFCQEPVDPEYAMLEHVASIMRAIHVDHAGLPDIAVLYPHVWHLAQDVGGAFVKDLEEWSLSSRHFLKIVQTHLDDINVLSGNFTKEPWLMALVRDQPASSVLESVWFHTTSVEFPLSRTWARLEVIPFAIVFPVSLLRRASLALWETVVSFRTNWFERSPAALLLMALLVRSLPNPDNFYLTKFGVNPS